MKFQVAERPMVDREPSYICSGTETVHGIGTVDYLFTVQLMYRYTVHMHE